MANKLDATITKHESSITNIEEVFTDNYEAFEEQQDEWVNDEEKDDTEPERIYTNEVIGEIKKEIEALNEFNALAKSITVNSKGEDLFTALTNVPDLVRWSVF